MVHPDQLELQASQGDVHLSTSVVAPCLTEPGCDIIRFEACGAKTSIDEEFVQQRPKQVDRRGAILKW